MRKQKYQKIVEKLGEERVKQNEILAPHTTFKIGGPADLFYEAKTTEELIRTVKLSREFKIPHFILGSGSKLLISDDGFRGLMIKVQNSKIKFQDEKVLVEPGMRLGDLISQTAEKGLSGLAFAAGIPGTVGGAVVGNAGVWQQGIGDKVLRIQVLNKNNQIEWLDVKDCRFGYRQSRFKQSGEIILAIELALKKANSNEIKEKIKINREKRADQPKEFSVGCIFVNPKPDSAGRMIDECGLKGKKIGDAQISPQHANFIINMGGAKAKEVIQLIELMEKKVEKKFGIKLEREIRLVGFK